jgi:uncharacterized membrane protein
MTFPLGLVATDVFLEAVYVLTGVVLFVFAAMTFTDRRHPHPLASGSFWLILGMIFVFGSHLPHGVTGVLILVMVALDGAGRVKPGAPPAEAVAREEYAPAPAGGVLPYESARVDAGIMGTRQVVELGNHIFLPVLTIPAVTVLFALVFRILGLDVTTGALIGLGFGGVAAMGVALLLTRGSVREMMQRGRHLNECMGAVNILPQLLASLGVIFAAAGVGKLIADGVIHVVPKDQLFLLVLANCLGMSLFTMVMGNSFAAFPVITEGVLIPLIVVPFGVDPAMAAIITLTAGSSGTLITPMAANFNIVPAALLEMKNPGGVMRFQMPFALVIWPAHVLLMWGLIRMGV